MSFMEVTEMARKGGKSTFKKHGRDHYVKMGLNSGKSRKKVSKIGKNPQIQPQEVL